MGEGRGGGGGGGGVTKKNHLHSPVIWRRESERESSRLTNVPSKCQDRQHCWRPPEIYRHLLGHRWGGNVIFHFLV